ncbi:Bax inhibitor-1/YccA family protein [Kocuria varians]|uniref:Bax inhibitor-1/YccA family protein n=1 Tax=Kocuria varians TaxID=1272 RepID=UPI0008398491|nr:Bax inhibitor-1/YccA family protein [Kocuria varians]
MAGGNPLLRDFNKKYATTATASPRGAEYSPENLERMYNAPAAGSAQTGRMGYDDVVMRTALVLGCVIVTAVAGWFMPALAVPGALVGLVLGLVNSFKREPSPVLIILYALAEGLFLGGVSGIFESQYPGVVVQAVIGTLAVFVSVLVLYKTGVLRATPRVTKFFFVAMMAYAIFALVNLGTSLLGGFDMRQEVHVFGIPLGLLVGAVAILLAVYSFVLDFENISDGVARGLPRKAAWSAAFGLTVTLIWTYVEILRLLSIIRSMSD